jgi:hypothetical protein
MKRSRGCHRRIHARHSLASRHSCSPHRRHWHKPRLRPPPPHPTQRPVASGTTGGSSLWSCWWPWPSGTSHADVRGSEGIGWSPSPASVAEISGWFWSRRASRCAGATDWRPEPIGSSTGTGRKNAPQQGRALSRSRPGYGADMGRRCATNALWALRVQCFRENLI